jgi:endonuclease/exonuclease/phosphatase family metal-dependent hydrolase
MECVTRAWFFTDRSLIARVCLAAFGALIFLASLPFAALSIFGKLLAAPLRGDFVYHHPKYAEPQKGESNELTVETFNIASLPPFMNPVGHLTNSRDRVWAFAQQLKEIDKDQLPDLFCLEELFDERSNAILMEELGGLYPYAVTNVGSHWGKLNSGLCILSKYQLTDVHFTAFGKCVGADSYANKGLLTAKVQLTAEKSVKIITTHLQSGSATAKCQIRKEELKMIDHEVDRSEDLPTIIAGDFNMSPYKDKLRNGELEDNLDFCGDKAHQTQFFTTHTDLKIVHDANFSISDEDLGGTAIDMKDPHVKANQIDHILFAKSSKYQLEDGIGSLRDPQFQSDHMAIKSTIIWKS